MSDKVKIIEFKELQNTLHRGINEIKNMFGKADSIIINRRTGQPVKYYIIRDKSEETFINSKNYKDPCIIINEIDVSDKIVEDEIVCKNWIFCSKADFSNSTFKKDINFHGSTFGGLTYFQQSTFKEKAFFDFSHFESKVYFHNGTFESEGSFSHTTFEDKGDFGNCTFNDEVDFAHHIFNGIADFRNTFFKSSNFKSSLFKDEVSFNNSTFVSEIDFSNSSFEKKTDFSEATFNDEVAFNFSTFHNRTEFIRTTFDAVACFSRVIFKDYVSFYDMIITKAIDFRGVSCRGETIIDFETLKVSNSPNFLYLKRIKKIDNEATRDNFHAIKRIFHDNDNYEYENQAYYWYKKFERKTNKDIGDQKVKDKRNGILRYPKWIFGKVRTAFNWLVLDVCSRYFTSPARVFTTMVIFISFSLGVYLFANKLSNETIGYLSMNSSDSILYHRQEVVDNQILYKPVKTASNPIPLKDENISSFEYYRYNVYFCIITFTTIGYGDIKPTGLLQIYAGLEGLFGVLLMSLFLVTAAKKVLW